MQRLGLRIVNRARLARARAGPALGERVDLYADGERWTDDPVPGASPVAPGWLVPGLVDMHAHPDGRG